MPFSLCTSVAVHSRRTVGFFLLAIVAPDLQERRSIHSPGDLGIVEMSGYAADRQLADSPFTEKSSKLCWRSQQTCRDERISRTSRNLWPAQGERDAKA
jgi:hypothetical protein